MRTIAIRLGILALVCVLPGGFALAISLWIRARKAAQRVPIAVPFSGKRGSRGPDDDTARIVWVSNAWLVKNDPHGVYAHVERAS